ncbi:MAG: hypothetical protein HPY55_10490 [Firmicutes bacterium]|nr:hypothetical protein [Bacillota bacterium]
MKMTDISQSLLRKDGYVAVQIARDLLGRRPGERLPRVQDYAETFQTGHGTIQHGLKLLVEAGAIALEARGHLGTYLAAMDCKKLWEISGQAFILGLMPLPYSRRYEGLATGVYEAFRKANVPFNLAYIRGSANRLQALERNQGDFVVLSRMSVEAAQKEHDITIVVGFGPRTYVGEHALVLRKGVHGAITEGMRVGVDPHSLDQCQLTRRLCEGKRVEMVEIKYTQVIEMLELGRIDAVVWNADEVPRSGKVRVVQIDLGPQSSNTEAVLVARKDRTEIERILSHVVVPSEVLEVQRQVLSGERIPSY